MQIIDLKEKVIRSFLDYITTVNIGNPKSYRDLMKAIKYIKYFEEDEDITNRLYNCLNPKNKFKLPIDELYIYIVGDLLEVPDSWVKLNMFGEQSLVMNTPTKSGYNYLLIKTPKNLTISNELSINVSDDFIKLYSEDGYSILHYKNIYNTNLPIKFKLEWE